jgi:hypothetical protein
MNNITNTDANSTYSGDIKEFLLDKCIRYGIITNTSYDVGNLIYNAFIKKILPK